MRSITCTGVSFGRGRSPFSPGATSDLVARALGPALAAAWRRTEEMVAIGLPHRSAVELSALAGPAGHVREDLFFRAGELFARAGDHAAAAERFIAAAERPALAAEALAGAIRSRRALGDIAGETALAERRARDLRAHVARADDAHLHAGAVQLGAQQFAAAQRHCVAQHLDLDVERLEIGRAHV